MNRLRLDIGHLTIPISQCDEALLPSLPLVPLVAHTGETSLPACSDLSIRVCDRADIGNAAAQAALAGGDRLSIPSPADFGPPVDVTVGAGGVTFICPEHGWAGISRDWSRADVRLVAPPSDAAGGLLAAVVLGIAAANGYHPIHASMAQKDGVGVLFCGERNQGKTSSSLALGRAGWRVLADDRCYVWRGPGGLEAWGPGGDMRLRSDASALWGDIDHAVARGADYGAKTVIELGELVADHGAEVARPGAIFFPDVVGHGEHSVEPLSAADALHEMLFTTGVGALPEHAAAHFELISDLVESTPIYALHLGEDMDSLHLTVEEALR